jgi:hypothetical protein
MPRSRQPWLVALAQDDGSLPAFEAYDDARRAWPADSLARWEAANAERASKRRQRAAKP